MELLRLKRTKNFWILVFLLGFAWGLPAQIPAANPDTDMAFLRQPLTSIRISTNLVTVPVSVTNLSGSAVSDLGIEDFHVAEDGREESIAKMINAGQSPLQLVLAFDLSGSIHSNFEFERTAARRFLEKVWKPGDTLSIISVSKHPEILLRNASSPEEAQKILSDLEPTEDATAFFDSIVMAADLLCEATAPNTRQAAVIFSDGEDNRSDNTFREALSALRHSDAAAYSINPSGPSIRMNEISLKGQQWLVSLTAKTGGTAFVLNRPSDLDGIYDRIAFELRAQYLLSYYSSNTRTDGSFRNISVTLPGKPELHVRARQGYYAVGTPADWGN
jgi:Ca-activated chloride channel family protein